MRVSFWHLTVQSTSRDLAKKKTIGLVWKDEFFFQNSYHNPCKTLSDSLSENPWKLNFYPTPSNILIQSRKGKRGPRAAHIVLVNLPDPAAQTEHTPAERRAGTFYHWLALFFTLACIPPLILVGAYAWPPSSVLNGTYIVFGIVVWFVAKIVSIFICDMVNCFDRCIKNVSNFLSDDFRNFGINEDSTRGPTSTLGGLRAFRQLQRLIPGLFAEMSWWMFGTDELSQYAKAVAFSVYYARLPPLIVVGIVLSVISAKKAKICRRWRIPPSVGTIVDMVVAAVLLVGALALEGRL